MSESRMSPAPRVVAVLSFCAGLGACSLWAESDAPRFDAARGKALFAANCAACHGADAAGDGPTARALGLTMPDLTTITRRNDGRFPRDRVMSIIDGYYRQVNLDDPMPIFGDHDLGPLIHVEEGGIDTPIPADLLALATYLDSLQEP